MASPLNLSYRDAGVDIDEGNALVEDIKPLIQATMRPEVLGGLGGFGGLFALPKGYEEPILVSGTDGIGTKLRLGIDTGQLDGLGIDLVAMCVNDVLVCGAEPLFFLDYFATGKLERAVATRVIAGVAKGCAQAGCSLIGGETAEMPGVYAPGDFDAAGFCVGIVEKSRMLSGESVAPGDVLLGLASSGAHSNGFSLIRRILEASGTPNDMPFGDTGQSIADVLLAPTRIYVKPVLELLRSQPVHAICHITGGGLPENLPRVLPQNCDAEIDSSSWPRPEIFRWLAETGGVAPAEMWRTFNCGIGLVLTVPADAVSAARAQLEAAGETVYEIGRITAGEQRVRMS
ncbi:MAG: phosphoribosylformylglycinamidine cyclo-ligase [Oceanococcaceae bacterium]